MDAFRYQGRYLDPVSKITYAWTSESFDFYESVAIHMNASNRNHRVRVTSTFANAHVHNVDENACVRAAMQRAEDALYNEAARSEGSNTRGVLRHLVQMARAVAA